MSDRLDDDALERALDPVPTEWERRPGLRPAAVLAPLVRLAVSGGDDDRLVFMQRPTAMRDHAGQIAFPGGRRDGDESPLACALRESAEEVGVDAERDVERVLGALPVRVSNAGYLVHTVVARLRDGFEPVACPREVDRILTATIDDLADDGRWAWRRVRGVARPLPFFDFDAAGALWGLTGRLTWDLLERMGRPLPDAPSVNGQER